MADLALSALVQKGSKAMSDNYTPGPWHNDGGLVCGKDIKHGGPSFDIFDASEWNGPESEGQANARLIAAAPEMLEALNVALFAMTNQRYLLPRLDMEKEHARVCAAIAKATGKEEAAP